MLRRRPGTIAHYVGNCASGAKPEYEPSAWEALRTHKEEVLTDVRWLFQFFFFGGGIFGALYEGSSHFGSMLGAPCFWKLPYIVVA